MATEAYESRLVIINENIKNPKEYLNIQFQISFCDKLELLHLSLKMLFIEILGQHYSRGRRRNICKLSSHKTSIT